MLMWWGLGGPVYALRLRCCCCCPLSLCCPTPRRRRPGGMGTLTAQARPPPQPQIPHIPHARTHGTEVRGLACLGAGGGGVYQRLAQVGHGGNTPLTPQLWPKELEAEESPDGSGRRIRQGWDRSEGCRGRCARRAASECIGAPSGAQPVHEGWGRLGAAGGNKGQRRVQGGCTLSLPFAPIETKCKLAHAPITERVGQGPVDGMGGVSECQPNNLDESFLCEPKCWEKERQAQPYPQNWVGWCPGSSLTNLSDPHPRAGLERPTSAEEVSFEMRSRLDHPRSHQCGCEHRPADWARLSSKPGSRRCDQKI